MSGEETVLKLSGFIGASYETPVGSMTLCGHLPEHRGVNLTRQPRVLDSNAVVFVINGSGTYEDADHTLSASAGQAILVHKGRPHWYGPLAGTTWDESFAILRGNVLDPWFSSAARYGPVFDACHLRERFIGWIDRSTDESGLVAQTRHLMEIQSLLFELISPIWSSAQGEPEWLLRVKRVLSSNLYGAFDPEAVAIQFGMGSSNLRKKFQRATGESLRDFREARRIEAVTETLQMSPLLTNSALAEAFGFYDEFHLSKTYRQRTGKTLNQVRNEVLGQPKR